MNPSKRTKPATAETVGRLRGIDLARQPDPSNTLTAPKSQAPPCPTDDAGESDLTFFSRRPDVNTRTRLPFPNEFPAGVLEPGRCAFVRVLIERDADGRPKRRARRRLRFCEGGTA
jgi:hypothetical protein